MNPIRTAIAAKKLASVACAAAFLVREGIIAEANYEKCLTVWIKKHAEDDALLLKLARSVLGYRAVVKDMPDNP